MFHKILIIIYNNIIKQVNKDIRSLQYPIRFEKLFVTNNKLTINQKVIQLKFMICALKKLKIILPHHIQYAKRHNLIINEIHILKSKRIIIKYRN